MARQVPESVLVRIWKEQRFRSDGLKTTTGLPIQVIRPGRRNNDAGPDFRNALIRIGEHVYAGDVELHLDLTDWYAHGHHTDPNYNRTVLHVVLWEGENSHSSDAQTPLIRKANGEDTPTVIVQYCVTEPLDTLIEVFQRADDRRRQKLFSCRKYTGERPIEQILPQLRQLGEERLYERARRFETWLRPQKILHPLTPPCPPLRGELKGGVPQEGNPSKGDFAAFQQLLYEALCEGLGYSSNKQPFLELARRLPLDRIYAHLPKNGDHSLSACLHWIQAMLFGTAGLLPPATEQSGVQTLVSQENDLETKEYIIELRSLWEMLSPCLDVIPLKPEEWFFFRLRPTNFPTRRIAALSYLLLNYTVQPVFESYLRLFTLFSEHPEQEGQHLRLLERTLEVPTAGYWKGRYMFGKSIFPSHDRVFLGKSRIRDILISAVFPVFLLYALDTGQAHLETQIVKLYTVFPAPDWNRVTRTVSTQLFVHCTFPTSLIRTAAIYQGLLHLYRHYCYLPACTDCPFSGVRC